MKKISLALLAGTLVFTGCKKGENDPFISLASRDSRIEGEWKLSKLSSTETGKQTDWSTGDLESFTNTQTFDGTSLIVTEDGESETYTYSYTLTINEDGTYSVVEKLNGINQDEHTGNWNWLDGDKNKSSVLLDSDGIFMIDRLAKDELVLIEKYKDKNYDSDGDLTYETDETTTKTFTQD